MSTLHPAVTRTQLVVMHMAAHNLGEHVVAIAPGFDPVRVQLIGVDAPGGGWNEFVAWARSLQRVSITLRHLAHSVFASLEGRTDEHHQVNVELINPFLSDEVHSEISARLRKGASTELTVDEFTALLLVDGQVTT
ncbi:hypothetical protein [Amycolatopsis palatopharyngis]|uniref:hypothetical protein n=1 Tax=Amycolatopsis palatopharyngis TaxID=187982 RepID=UPI000E27B8AC|nr:hypothetical protein [Amycolatopsis palatopharyngis]